MNVKRSWKAAHEGATLWVRVEGPVPMVNWATASDVVEQYDTLDDFIVVETATGGCYLNDRHSDSYDWIPVVADASKVCR